MFTADGAFGWVKRAAQRKRRQLRISSGLAPENSVSSAGQPSAPEGASVHPGAPASGIDRGRPASDCPAQL